MNDLDNEHTLITLGLYETSWVLERAVFIQSTTFKDAVVYYDLTCSNNIHNAL